MIKFIGKYLVWIDRHWPFLHIRKGKRVRLPKEDLLHWLASWKNICKLSNPGGCGKCELNRGGLALGECESAELEIKRLIEQALSHFL